MDWRLPALISLYLLAHCFLASFSFCVYTRVMYRFWLEVGWETIGNALW